MTVIAYTSGKMVSDTRTTVTNGGYGIKVQKILKTGDGWLVGFAGPCSQCYQALELNRKKMNLKKNPNKDDKEDTINGLAVSPKGQMWLLDSGGWFPFEASYHAIGSGADVAIGAMAAGMSAHGAVVAAISHNAYCGDQLTILELDASA